MSRRLVAVVVGFAIILAPTGSFAFNAAALASAKSCCDGMANSCSDSKAPVECCDKVLVTIEGAVQLAKIVLQIDLPPARYNAESSGVARVALTPDIAAAPPIASSPPLVLRI